jgi:hypothetical protein
VVNFGTASRHRAHMAVHMYATPEPGLRINKDYVPRLPCINKSIHNSSCSAIARQAPPGARPRCSHLSPTRPLPVTLHCSHIPENALRS